jgi:hypothetical protein
MNRAALAARAFAVIAIVPTVCAAGYAVYEYRHQTAVISDRAGRIALSGDYSALTKGMVLGVFAPTVPHTGQSPGRAGSAVRQLVKFEHAIHHKVSLSVVYLNWGDRFPGRYISEAAKVGAETVVQVEPRGKGVPSLAKIAAGRGDGWLRRFAARLSATGYPLILSFGPEMNGTWYTYGSGSNTARNYIRAFRHVHDTLIRDVGHDLTPAQARRLIRFMWQPSAIHIKTPSPVPFWPGHRYVNLIGLDGYYYHSTDTFGIIFDRTIHLLRTLSPTTRIMIGETAVGPMTGHQAAGIKNLFAGLKRDKLAGLIWFNRNQLGINYGSHRRIFHQDWRLQDHPAALRAFIARLKKAGRIASFTGHP